MVSTKIIVAKDVGVQSISMYISESSKKIHILILPEFTFSASVFLREETAIFLNEEKNYI